MIQLNIPYVNAARRNENLHIDCISVSKDIHRTVDFYSNKSYVSFFHDTDAFYCVLLLFFSRGRRYREPGQIREKYVFISHNNIHEQLIRKSNLVMFARWSITTGPGLVYGEAFHFATCRIIPISEPWWQK